MEKNARASSAPTTPPATCAPMYAPASRGETFLIASSASVTAGLTWQPEIDPIAPTSSISASAWTSPSGSSDTTGDDCETKPVIARTRIAVPTNSARYAGAPLSGGYSVAFMKAMLRTRRVSGHHPASVITLPASRAKRRPTTVGLDKPGARRAVSPTVLKAITYRAANLRAQRALSTTALDVRAQRLTYLTPRRLLTLQRCADEVNDNAVTGAFVECGLALGGSSILSGLDEGRSRAFSTATTSSGSSRRLCPNDPPAAHARHTEISFGRLYGTRRRHLLRLPGRPAGLGHRVVRVVRASPSTPEQRSSCCTRASSTTRSRSTGPSRCAHVDSDWFDPVDTCLRRIGPHLQPGGYIVLDDYYDYGCCA